MSNPNNQQPNNKPADKNAAPKHDYKDKEFQKRKPGRDSDNAGLDDSEAGEDRE